MKMNTKLIIMFFSILAFIIFLLFYIDKSAEKVSNQNKQIKQTNQIKKVLKPKIIYKEKIVYRNKADSIITISKDTLIKDIKNYKNISSANKALILQSIYKYSKKYNINPLIIYAVLATESSFRFWIKHGLVTIIVKDKKIKTRAIGIGAIIYEWWGPELIKNHIIETKSDLYNIPNNIEATCYILSKNMEKPILKGLKTKQESAFLRYFGGSKATWYVDRVNKVLANLLKTELYTK